MIDKIIRLANQLDRLGLIKEADGVDALIEIATLGGGMGGRDPAEEFYDALKSVGDQYAIAREWSLPKGNQMIAPDYGAIITGFDKVYNMVTRAKAHEGGTPRGFFSRLYEKYTYRTIADMFNLFHSTIHYFHLKTYTLYPKYSLYFL